MITMGRNFDNIEITPDQLMRHRLETGEIKISEYAEWIITDRSWESVKEFYANEIINKASLQ